MVVESKPSTKYVWLCYLYYESLCNYLPTKEPKTKRKQLLNIYREAFLFLYKEYSSVVVL